MITCQANIWINVIYVVLLFIVFCPGVFLNCWPISRGEALRWFGLPEKDEQGNPTKVPAWTRVFGTGVVNVGSFVIHLFLMICFAILFFYLSAALVTECL